MAAFDAAVVGSGVAGLVSACLLAETGRRVVVLERHTVPGGLLQRFRRRGITFDTGFHYVGGLGPGGVFRRYLRRLGVLERIPLEPYHPDGFDEVVLPGRRVRFPVGWERVADALAREFPRDAAAARAYLGALRRALDAHPFYSFCPEALSPSAVPAGPETTVGAALATMESAELRAVLSAHTMLYGVPAHRAPLEAHAMVTGSLFHSAHGVRGGGGALAEALVGRLRELGGEVRPRSPVRRIRVEGGRVAGVATESGELPVREVVAAVHPALALELVGEDTVPRRVASRVRALRNGYSALLVHGVVRGGPGAPPRRNWFWLESPEVAWTERQAWFDAGRPPPSAVVLSGSAASREPGAAVFHVFCPVLQADAYATAEPDAWRARKEVAARRAVEVLERCVPEWRGRHEVIDVSGPGAIQRFVASPDGAVYGAECSVEQWNVRRSLASLGVLGLRLAGQSVGVPGVLGAVVTAFLAVGALTGETARLYAELRASDEPC